MEKKREEKRDMPAWFAFSQQLFHLALCRNKQSSDTNELNISLSNPGTNCQKSIDKVGGRVISFPKKLKLIANLLVLMGVGLSAKIKWSARNDKRQTIKQPEL